MTIGTNSVCRARPTKRASNRTIQTMVAVSRSAEPSTQPLWKAQAAEIANWAL